MLPTVQIKGIREGLLVTLGDGDWADVSENLFKEIDKQADFLSGAKLILDGRWKKAGVHTPEQFDPEPFMEEIGGVGLPWEEEIILGSEPILKMDLASSGCERSEPRLPLTEVVAR